MKYERLSCRGYNWIRDTNSIVSSRGSDWVRKGRVSMQKASREFDVGECHLLWLHKREDREPEILQRAQIMVGHFLLEQRSKR